MHTLDRVRSVLQGELGDGRLEGVAADQPLLRSGLINSLEIVSVTLALEAGFGIKIPAAAANPENFADLNAIARLVDSLKSGAKQPLTMGGQRQHRLAASLFAALKRPLLLGLCFVLAALAIDGAIRLLIAGPFADDYRDFAEDGHRLYPVAGNHSQDDFEFAVSQHRILRSPPTDSTWRVAVFGDSGTIGSWLPWQDSIAAQAAAALRATGGAVELFNLAYFIRALPKDMMILGAVLKQSGGRLPFDAVVLTLSDEYFSRSHFDHSARSYAHLSLNADLLMQLKPLVAAAYHPLLDRMVSAYKRQGKRLGNPVVARLQKHSALFHYSAYIRERLNRDVYAPLGKPKFAWRDEFARGTQPMFDPVPPRPPRRDPVEFNGLAPEELDNDVVALLQAMLEGFAQRGIPVVLYLEPTAPKEWQAYLAPPRGSVTTAQVLAKVCSPPACRIADARWLLSGTQFTDSLAHYTKSGNAAIAAVVAEALRLARPTQP
ncbi:MAG: hypothetical protein HZC24_07020 [Rhodocyclales bacterium]|nr:hypothetical protein [Rhodocyclales bacterium]